MSEVATGSPASTSAPAASAPASTPATTSSAPATSTPAPTSTPSTSFNPKEFSSAKSAMDAFVKSKLTAAVGQQPEAPVASTSEPVTPAEGTPAESPLQPAEKAQETAAVTETPVDVAPDPELQIDPKIDKMVSPKVRAVLKMLADPKTGLPVDGKVRKEIVDNYYIGKSVRDSGVPVAALKEYLNVAPTVDVLRNISENATLHAKMLSDYSENPSTFAEQLYHTNQEAFHNLVGSLTDPGWLQQTFPKSFASIAKTGTRNYLDNALAEAQRSGDADLEAAVGKLMEWGGLASPPQSQAAPPAELDPLQERVMQLEAERAQFYTERQNAFIQGAYQRAATNVAERIGYVVEQAASDSPFNERAQGRIRAEIGARLYRTVTQNEHVIRTLKGLVTQGNGDATHLERVANYLQSQAIALLPAISREVIEEYSELVGPAMVRREEKVQKVLSQRSPASGGKPVTPAPAAFNPKQFGNMKEAFDAFTRHRLGG